MKRKPNLVFIFTDEQAADTMAAYGNKRIHTPHMNRLAHESIVFRNAYVTQPVCTPSRSTLVTGLYPHTNGCIENNAALQEDTLCFPQLGDFSEYKTAYIGKWHLGDEIFAQHGFEEWKSIEDHYRGFYRKDRDKSQLCSYSEYLMEKGYAPDQITKDSLQGFSREFCAKLPEEHGKPAYVAREASRFIRLNRETPFILYVNFIEPHMPFSSPRDEQYDRTGIPLPESFHHALSDKQPLKVRLLRQAYRELGFEGKELKTEEDWKDLIARYWGLVSLVDTHLGTVLDTLVEMGLEEQTILVYTSDHGDMMGCHRLLAKCVMYEEAVKVPLLLKVPGLACEGRVIENPVSHIDLVPTLLEAMGQPVPGHLEGFSWMPFLQGTGRLVEDNVFIEWNGHNNGFGDLIGRTRILDIWKDGNRGEEIAAAFADPVRTIVTPDGWKYNHSQLGEHELYNLTTDPYEQHNLYGNDGTRELVEGLYGKILDWQRRTGDRVGRE